MARIKANKLKWAMLIITVLAIALTSYLTYIHYEGLSPVCSLGQSCIKVQTSIWSKLAGVPVALIGLLGYIGIFGVLLLPEREETRLTLLGMTLIGFGFSLYLTYREIFSIKAICEECATSAVFITVLFILSVVRYLRAPAGLTPTDFDPDGAPAPAGSPSTPVAAGR
jgi:uncharacterized membrane protein